MPEPYSISLLNDSFPPLIDGVANTVVNYARELTKLGDRAIVVTPDSDIIALGTRVLRIEAFAEAMYGASIVAGGVFQGAGSTLVPTLFNLGTMWGIRLPLAWLAAPRWGLPGVWAAMCAELCVRGLLYLIRLGGKRWLPPEGPAGQV